MKIGHSVVLAALVSLCVSAPLPALAASGYPDYLSLGLGAYNFDKHADNRKSMDYRIEYRDGTSLLPLISRQFKKTDRFLRFHPTVGIEGNTRGAFYANAGFNMDVPFLRYGIFTWGESLGFFSQGNDVRDMGSALEMRSQIELGVQFKNNLRVTGYISHISNGWSSSDNPGAEIVGAYVHIPLSVLGMK